MNGEDRRTVGLTMVAHAAFHAYELAIPVFVVAWLDAFETTTAALGVVVGAGYALVGLGAVPSGLLADRYGSKRLVVASLAGMGVGFGLVGVAPSLLLLSVALVCWGTAASVYHPAGLSLLSRTTAESGRAFAYHGVAGNVGTVVGPLAAAVLLAGLDWRVVAVGFALPAVLTAVAASQVEVGGRDEVGERVGASGDGSEASGDGNETTDGTAARSDGGSSDRISSVSEFGAASRRLFSGRFPVLFGVVMCYGLYYRGTLTFLPETLAGLALFEPVELAGTTLEPSRYVYAGLLFAGGLGQYVGGRLGDAVSPERALSVSFAVLAGLALGFLPASNLGVGPLLAVCVAIGFTVFFVAPLYQLAIAERVDSDAHGLSYGYTYLGTFGVGALGATGSGAVLAVAGPPTLFVLLAGLAALAGGLSRWVAGDG